MERWLKILLEWDPAKRGRALNKNKEQEIVVFHLIDDILSKKVCNYVLFANYMLNSQDLGAVEYSGLTFIPDCKRFLCANISEFELRD
jgi:hypothetical protein